MTKVTNLLSAPAIAFLSLLSSILRDRKQCVHGSSARNAPRRRGKPGTLQRFRGALTLTLCDAGVTDARMLSAEPGVRFVRTGFRAAEAETSAPHRSPWFTNSCIANRESSPTAWPALFNNRACRLCALATAAANRMSVRFRNAGQQNLGETRSEEHTS